MSYAKLYEHVQGISGRISRNVLKAKIKELTGQEPMVFIRGMDIGYFRGMFLLGESDTVWTKWSKGEACILVARDQDDVWKRFVEVKELMHLFDAELDFVGTDDDFEVLLERLTGSFAPNQTALMGAFISEHLAIFMALGVLCSERHRQELIRCIDNQETTPEKIAAELDIPLTYVHFLIGPTFKEVMDICVRRHQ